MNYYDKQVREGTGTAGSCLEAVKDLYLSAQRAKNAMGKGIEYNYTDFAALCQMAKKAGDIYGKMLIEKGDSHNDNGEIVTK